MTLSASDFVISSRNAAKVSTHSLPQHCPCPGLYCVAPRHCLSRYNCSCAGAGTSLPGPSTVRCLRHSGGSTQATCTGTQVHMCRKHQGGEPTCGPSARAPFAHGLRWAGEGGAYRYGCTNLAQSLAGTGFHQQAGRALRSRLAHAGCWLCSGLTPTSGCQPHVDSHHPGNGGAQPHEAPPTPATTRLPTAKPLQPLRWGGGWGCPQPHQLLAAHLPHPQGIR